MVIDNVKDYWNRIWKGRINGDGSINGNSQKVEFLMKELWERPYLIKARKLEIGCGPATHVRAMCHLCSEFGKRYIGIDTSEVALKEAETSGLLFDQTSIHDFKTEKRFDAFFFFDVLEHIEDHESVARKVKSLAANSFCVIINIPLYKSDHIKDGGYERSVDINDMYNFMHNSGIEKVNHKIYGINGYPYMFLEGFKS